MFKTLAEIIKRLFKGMPNDSSKIQSEEIILKRGSSEKIKLPPQLDETSNYKIIKWNFHVGDLVKNGDIICVLENDLKSTTEFYCYLKGRLNYRFPENQKITAKSVIAEFVSTE